MSFPPSEGDGSVKFRLAIRGESKKKPAAGEKPAEPAPKEGATNAAKPDGF